MIYFPGVKPEMKQMGDQDLSIKIGEFESQYKANERNRLRFIRNMMVVTGLNYDQFADDWRVVENMLSEGRTPKTYNFIQMYVRGLAGNMIMNWFDPKFIDREDDSFQTQAVLNAFQRVWYVQKEHFNYKQSIISCIWNGLTGRGVEELVIDRTMDPRGQVRFESIRPDMIDFDPTVLDDNISRKAKLAWKRFYLTPEEMLLYYPWMEEEIKEKARALQHADKSLGFRFEENPVRVLDDDRSVWGSKHLTFEEYRIEHTKKKKLIHTETGMPFPDSGFELGTEEDFIAKVIWGQERGINVTPENITEIEVYEPELWLTTIVRDMGLILECRKDERQFGHLPFYSWSFIEKYGQSIGVVDLIHDAQDDLNKRDNQKTKLMTQTPIGGKAWIHPDAYGANDQTRQQMIENFNDSGEPIVLDEDAPPGVQLFGMMQGPNVNGSLFAEENVKIDYMNKIASLPLAMQGITERANESGLMLGRKVIEGSVMQRIPMEGLIQHENNKAEDWLKVMTHLLSGEGNYNRKFVSPDQQVEVIMNEFMGYDETGTPLLRNNVEAIDIERTDVVISMSKENDFMRQAKRETDAAILNSIQPTPTNGAAIAAFVTDLIQSSDFQDETQREKAEKAADLYYKLEMTNGMAALNNAKLSLAQTELALKQVQQQAAMGGMPGGAPQPGPGMEAPGGAPSPAGPMQPEGGQGERIPVPPVESVREEQPVEMAG